MDVESRRQLIIMASDLGFAAAEQDRAKAFLGDGGLGFNIDDAEKDIPVTDEVVTIPCIAAVIHLNEEMPRLMRPERGGACLQEGST